MLASAETEYLRRSQRYEKSRAEASVGLVPPRPKYLRRSQRYEKSSAETSYACFGRNGVSSAQPEIRIARAKASSLASVSSASPKIQEEAMTKTSLHAAAASREGRCDVIGVGGPQLSAAKARILPKHSGKADATSQTSAGRSFRRRRPAYCVPSQAAARAPRLLQLHRPRRC